MIGYLQAFSGHIEMEHTNIRTSQHMILTMQVSSLERALIALLKAIAIAHIQAVPRLRRGYGNARPRSPGGAARKCSSET